MRDRFGVVDMLERDFWCEGINDTRRWKMALLGVIGVETGDGGTVEVANVGVGEYGGVGRVWAVLKDEGSSWK